MSDTLAKAAQAEAALAVTDEHFDDLRAAVIERWASTGVDHIATREKMFLTVQVIDAVRKSIREAVAAGAVERFAQANAELLQPADDDRR